MTPKAPSEAEAGAVAAAAGVGRAPRSAGQPSPQAAPAANAAVLLLSSVSMLALAVCAELARFPAGLRALLTADSALLLLLALKEVLALEKA